MSLIYKIKYPTDIFRSISGVVSSLTGNDEFSYDVSLIRPLPFDQLNYTVPRIDITSKDLKVSTKLADINSKVTYDISFRGETAGNIIKYIKYVRLPGGTEASPVAIPGLEYLFNLDKQIGITIYDDCCSTTPKLIVEGYIPLNTVRYCEDACTVSCTIYEDGARANALSCFTSTVLGLKSNVGFLQTAEKFTDYNYKNQTPFDDTTRFAEITGKWFDVCVEPQSTGIPFILTNLLGVFKIIISIVLTPLIAAVAGIQLIINVIISAINTVPGINISLLQIFDTDDSIFDIVDDIFSLERVVEGLFGCKYVRGGYRVASIITTACSICGLSRKELLSDFETFNTEASGLIDMLEITTPISSNPFVINGNMGAILRDKVGTYNTAYMPAEEAYKRKKEEKVARERNEDIAVRAASIETTDKIFDRLSSLWGNDWNIVNTPISATAAKGLQLMLGPNEGRYSFRKEDFVNTTGMDVCYSISEGSPIGFSTTWQQDSADIAANSQIPNYNGYITYFYSNLKDRKSQDVKDYPVQFAPAHYIGSLKDDTVYDDLASNRSIAIGFTQLDEFFEDGTLVQSSQFTTVPKLIRFETARTNVLNAGRTCRVAKHNDVFSSSYRMSTDIYSEVISVTTEKAILKKIDPGFASANTGIQNNLPHYSIGYFGEYNLIPNTFTDANIYSLIEDYLKKYGSEEVGYTQAKQRVRTKEPSYLGPFNNLASFSTTISDNSRYKFTPLMDFSISIDNYTCGQDDLFNQCVTEAVRVTSTPGVDDLEVAFKLRLVKLKLGLGVVTELEIDYENRKIEASGYVIPFVQGGVDYSN